MAMAPITITTRENVLNCGRNAALDRDFLRLIRVFHVWLVVHSVQKGQLLNFFSQISFQLCVLILMRMFNSSSFALKEN